MIDNSAILLRYARFLFQDLFNKESDYYKLVNLTLQDMRLIEREKV